MSVLSQLLTLWLDTAINTLMTGRRTRDVKLWFLIDELGALHRLPSLEKGLQTARNFGGAIVTGVHAFAKLKEVYGENMAMTLSSLARTKLILATADRETATWCSDIIGHREVREMEEGYSYGYNNARDAVSLTPRRQVVPLLLPDEFMGLRSLSGFIKFPDGFPAAPVTLTPRKWPRVAEGFIPHSVDQKPAVNSSENSDQDKAKSVADQAGDGDTDSGDPRRLAQQAKPPGGPQKVRRDGDHAGTKKGGKKQQVQPNRQASGTYVHDVRLDAGSRPPGTAIAEAVGQGQAKLPLGDGKSAATASGRQGGKDVRSDGHDSHGEKHAVRERNQASLKHHEDQQRGLLGGASKPGPDRDMGDVDPDI